MGQDRACPLSPLLFALYIEPFIRTLQTSILIQPLVTASSRLKVTAYADDLAIFSTNPAETVSAVVQAATEFGSISGYKLKVN